MKLQFTKMHSLGNDFIVMDEKNVRSKNVRGLAKKLCSRRFGIGADQMLLLGSSKKADHRMRILNADGSEVEMCGNGIRCLAKYVWEQKRRSSSISRHLSIETLGGIKYLRRAGDMITVDMGEPVLAPDKIPVSTGQRTEALIEHPMKVKNRTFRITCVSMGNPHAVIFVNNVNVAPVLQYGPLIERHKAFPKRTNVEFVQVLNRASVRMRVWERGAGETMACGTGASASAVASVLRGLTGRKVTVHLPGGKLIIDWSAKDNHVYMTGDAVKVFEGTVDI